MFLIVIVIFCIIITDQGDNLNHVVKESKEFLQCYASYCDHLANFFFNYPQIWLPVTPGCTVCNLNTVASLAELTNWNVVVKCKSLWDVALHCKGTAVNSTSWIRGVSENIKLCWFMMLIFRYNESTSVANIFIKTAYSDDNLRQ